MSRWACETDLNGLFDDSYDLSQGLSEIHCTQLMEKPVWKFIFIGLK